MILAGWMTVAAALAPVWGAAFPIMRPLRFDAYWLLLMAPLVIGISVTYKAINLEDLSMLPRESMLMASQIVVFMVVAAAIIFAMTQVM